MEWPAQLGSFVPWDVDCCCSQLGSVEFEHPRWLAHTAGSWHGAVMGAPQISFMWPLHVAGHLIYKVAGFRKVARGKLPVLFRLGFRSPRTALGLLSTGQGQSSLQVRINKLHLFMWEATWLHREEKNMEGHL